MTSGPPGTLAAAPWARAAPAVVPACTTCSLPARVMRSCWLDTADSLMVGRGLVTRCYRWAGAWGPAPRVVGRRPARLRRRAAAMRRNHWRGGGGGDHAPFGQNFLMNGPAPGHGRPPEPVLRRPVAA